jgi:hypothetical protein
MPLPDSDRALDILDTYVTAIREANVDPIADALVDDRRDADTTGLGQRLQARGNIDAIPVDIVALDNNVAKIDSDSQYDGWLRRAWIRRRGTGALHRKCAVYGIDHAAKLCDGAIADQFHNPAVMGGDRRAEDGFPVPF